MVPTGAGTKNIFRRVDHIHIAYIHHQLHGYVGLTVIVNLVNQFYSKPFVSVSSTTFSHQCTGSKNIYDRVRSDMIANDIEVSITKTYLNKLRLHCGEYEWTDAGGLKSNDRPTMI